MIRIFLQLLDILNKLVYLSLRRNHWLETRAFLKTRERKKLRSGKFRKVMCLQECHCCQTGVASGNRIRPLQGTNVTSIPKGFREMNSVPLTREPANDIDYYEHNT